MEFVPVISILTFEITSKSAVYVAEVDLTHAQAEVYDAVAGARRSFNFLVQKEL